MTPLLDLSLAHGALLIAADEYPSLPIFKYLKRLDFMGYELQSRLLRTSARAAASGDRLDQISAKVSGEERLETMIQYLFSEQGFQGNSLNYYDPKNNFLNEVLDRRLGLPITLSILAIEMCSRVGLKAWGLGFPAHFMVGVEVREGENVVLDPFHNGSVLKAAEVRERLKGAGNGGTEQYVMDQRAIFTRLLNNLKVIYWTEKRFDKALSVLERLVELNPGQITEFRDRGLAHYQTGRYAHALIDLERYLLEVDARAKSAAIELEAGEVECVAELVRWLRRRVPSSPTLH